MRKLKCAISFLIVTAAGAISAADETWHLLIEPTFMHYEVELADRGRRENGSGAGALRERRSPSLRRATKSSRFGATRDKILASATESCLRGARRAQRPASFATKTMSSNAPCLNPTSPLTASAVLAPEFATLFQRDSGSRYSRCDSQSLSNLCVSKRTPGLSALLGDRYR